MIHNIVIPWGNIDFDVDLRIKEVKGDTIVLNVTVDGVDLSDYKIRCEIYNCGNSIQLGNEAVVGSNADINSVAAESGMSAFQIIVPAALTTNFQHYGTLEIEVENTSGSIFTILQQRVTFLDENIDWNLPS